MVINCSDNNYICGICIEDHVYRFGNSHDIIPQVVQKILQKKITIFTREDCLYENLKAAGKRIIIRNRPPFNCKSRIENSNI